MKTPWTPRALLAILAGAALALPSPDPAGAAPSVLAAVAVGLTAGHVWGPRQGWLGALATAVGVPALTWWSAAALVIALAAVAELARRRTTWTKAPDLTPGRLALAANALPLLLLATGAGLVGLGTTGGASTATAWLAVAVALVAALAAAGLLAGWRARDSAPAWPAFLAFTLLAAGAVAGATDVVPANALFQLAAAAACVHVPLAAAWLTPRTGWAHWVGATAIALLCGGLLRAGLA